MTGTVLVFVKAPRAGLVKTRLAAGIGAGRATALFRIMIERTIAEATAGPWETVLCIDPPSAVVGWDHLFPPALARWPQGAGDLGDRMGRALRNVPPGPVLMIGADAPGLHARHLRAAFQALGAHDAVFGPANDGGYWLAGLARRRAAPDLFSDVRWSTAHALADTKASLPAHFSIAEIDMLSDIDEASDLVHFGRRSTAR